MSALPLSLQMQPVSSKSPISRETDSKNKGVTLPRKSKSNNTRTGAAGGSRGSNVKWNVLPKIGETLHPRKHSMNVTYTDSTHVFYDPRYNRRLNKVDVFMQFNEQCPLEDVVTMAHTRLESFAKFLNYYYESRKFMMSDTDKFTESSHFPREIDGINFQEVDYLVQLWHLQCLRFLNQTKSLLFSSGVVKSLLQRRQNMKHGFGHGQFDDTDILVIRSDMSDSFWGWQVAYDEPSLNVIDYVLDVSLLSRNVERGLTRQSSTKKLSVRDIMGRSAEDIADSSSSTDSLEHQNQSDSDISSTNTTESPERDSFAAARQPPASSSKFFKAAHAGSSGIVHFFKKKSTSGLSTTPSMVDIGTTPNTDPLSTPPPSADGTSTFTLKNKWLENHYSRKLSNFLSVHTPPHYHAPTPSSSEEDVDEKKMIDYKLQYLKIKLPFNDNSIPSILCPSLWFHLRFDKWKTVLEEFYRCLIPGGSLQTENFDFKGSSIDSEDQCSLGTTRELRKILEAASLEAMKDNIQVLPMRHLVFLLNEIGFVNVKCCVMSLTRGDMTNDLGCVYEFLSMYHYDTIIRRHLWDPSLFPENTNPATFPLRYFNEHNGKVDTHVGALRLVCITAEKPLK